MPLMTWLRNNARALACLFVAVLAAYVGVNAVLLAAGRAPIWNSDPRQLYLNFFIYEGETIRQAFAGLISGQGFFLPLYNFDMGYGADVPTAVYGDNSDPLTLLSALVAPEAAEGLYSFLSFLRIELAAFAFFYYCRRKGNDGAASAVGALVYAFCGYALFYSTLRHPQFANTLIYLPFILAGADKVFERGRAHLFIVAVALQFITSLYFCFMTCFVLLGYCIVKYAFAVQDKSVRGFLTLAGRLAGFLAIGLCIGAVFTVPPILSIVSGDRAGIERSAQLFEPFGKYALYPSELLAAGGSESMAYVGPVGLVSLVMFIVGRKHFDQRVWRAGVVALVVMLVVWVTPGLSRVLNGFSYATDRWMFAFGFCAAYVVCLTVPRLASFGRAEWRRAAAAVAVISVFVFAVETVNKHMLVAGIAIALFVVCFGVVLWASTRGRRQRPVRFRALTLMVCIIVGCVVAGLTYFVPLGTWKVESYTKIGSAYDEYATNNPFYVARDAVAADPDYRVSRPEKYSMWNAPVNLHIKGIDFMSSIYNQNVDDLRKELGFSERQSNYHFVGSDLHSAIDTLTGAKYYVCREDELWKVPWGYEGPVATQGRYQLFVSSNALPVAFSTRKVVDAGEYSQLPMERKQQALLQGIVLDGAADLDGLKAEGAGDLTFDSYAPATTVAATGDITYGDGAIEVADGTNEVTYSFEPASGCELYLVIDNLRYTPLDHGEYAELLDAQGTSGLKKILKVASFNPPGNFSFKVSAGGRSESYSCPTDEHPEFCGKKDWVVNLGYFGADELVSELKLKIITEGHYAYDDIRIVCQPVEGMAREAAELNDGNLTDLRQEGNTMSARVACDGASSELAFFSVPYSEGWSATVDGQPAEVLRADTAFMAVQVTGEGSHEVVLTYETPGLRTGAIVSAVGILAYAAYVLVSRLRRKRSE